MTQQEKFIAKYGNPLLGKVSQEMFEKEHMMSYVYPHDIAIAIPCLGKSLYCNKDFVSLYEVALRNLILTGLHLEIKENDQCFMPRYQRGSTTEISIHTWGMAVDLNPDQNPIFSTREQCISKGLIPFTDTFIKCMRASGFTCGADFIGRPDLMHFQINLT